MIFAVECEELKVEIGDQNAVKNMLDDAIVDFFQEKQSQYTLHYGWDNAKLLIMLIAGLIAAASHFYKHPSIPESTIVYSCVAAYVQLPHMHHSFMHAHELC